VANLAVNLDQMGFYPRTIAVFGAMHDKDIAGMLQRMRPLVDAWHFTDLPIARAASAQELAAALAVLEPAAPAPASVQCHANPADALTAALNGADPADRIVVFGSFFTVGGVLAAGLPRLAARHLQ
jgi:dihydrofolate synthase/folylpolyglutamate synthase